MKMVFLLIVSTIFLNCQSQTVTKVKAGDFEKGIAADSAQVLDVRTAGEYGSGHIKNSLQANWIDKEQFFDRVQYMDKNRPVYIYCLVGGRSAAAAEWMRSNGFKKVVELDGGLNAWKRAAKPLEGVSNEKQLTVEEYWASIPKDQTVLVDFGATWCPPSVKMEPVLEEIKQDKSLHFQLLKIDAGIHTDVMKSLNIEPIPVFIIYKEGKEVWRKVGLVTKEEFAAQLK